MGLVPGNALPNVTAVGPDVGIAVLFSTAAIIPAVFVLVPLTVIVPLSPDAALPLGTTESEQTSAPLLDEYAASETPLQPLVIVGLRELLQLAAVAVAVILLTAALERFVTCNTSGIEEHPATNINAALFVALTGGENAVTEMAETEFVTVLVLVPEIATVPAVLTGRLEVNVKVQLEPADSESPQVVADCVIPLPEDGVAVMVCAASVLSLLVTVSVPL